MNGSRHTSALDDAAPDLDGSVELRRPEVAAGGALLVVAVVLTALNLRPAITSVGPLLGDMRDDLGTSALWAGLLTTLPGLCFAAAGLTAPWLARRFGIGSAIAAALLVLTTGLLLRVIDGPHVVIGGTLVATAGIALINVLIPVVIKGSFPARIGLMTGIYTAALQGGGAAGSAVTPALDEALGGWRFALGAWAVLAAAALIVWLIAMQRRRAAAGPAPRMTTVVPNGRSLLRSRLAWIITGFFGCQSLLAYVVMGWLPQVFIDNGMSKGDAGLLLGLNAVIAVPISIVVAPMASRRPSQSAWIVGLGLLGITGVAGLAIAPAAAPLLWTVLLGLGMSVFSLALAVIALRARTAEDTARLSGMVQGLGYLLAGVGPFAFGLLHELSGGWTVPWVMLMVVYVIQIVLGALAGRPRYV
ncbi:CynX/NimT family MFS transporter [Mycolicibacterium frederiksbergense]|uniref:CynX/NimT family MFS transporter n=1 Tax=Mycolicibacterium frederiksbergense TaxID=117567 RepID=UPI00265BC28E|nr:MFS transporter [Mycolicibacterium frederiksbergense]MDO0976568.1 MFS transporter [Mycolicibacterium frederiksbergense]